MENKHDKIFNKKTKSIFLALRSMHGTFDSNPLAAKAGGRSSLLCPHGQNSREGLETPLLAKPYATLGVAKKKREEPLIFSKKQKKEIKVIPLKVKTNDVGYIRHFTPAAQE